MNEAAGEAQDPKFLKAKELIKTLLKQVVEHPNQPLGIFRIVKIVERKIGLDTRRAHFFVLHVTKSLRRHCSRWQEPHQNWIVFKPEACDDCDKRVECLVDPQGGL